MKTIAQHRRTAFITSRRGRPAGLVTVATLAAFGMSIVSAQMTPTQPAPSAPTAPPSTAATSANEAMFKRIDSDGNGSISKAELEKADATLGRDFDRYDTDRDGKLSMAEFEAMLKAIRAG